MSDIDGGDRPQGESETHADAPQPDEPEATEAAPEPAESPETAEPRQAADDPLAAIKAERDALVAEVADLKDKLLRAVAAVPPYRGSMWYTPYAAAGADSAAAAAHADRMAVARAGRWRWSVA